jgi:hypothetical protein
LVILCDPVFRTIRLRYLSNHRCQFFLVGSRRGITQSKTYSKRQEQQIRKHTCLPAGREPNGTAQKHHCPVDFHVLACPVPRHLVACPPSSWEGEGRLACLPAGRLGGLRRRIAMGVSPEVLQTDAGNRSQKRETRNKDTPFRQGTHENLRGRARNAEKRKNNQDNSFNRDLQETCKRQRRCEMNNRQ